MNAAVVTCKTWLGGGHFFLTGRGHLHTDLVNDKRLRFWHHSHAVWTEEARRDAARGAVRVGMLSLDAYLRETALADQEIRSSLATKVARKRYRRTRGFPD